MTWQFHKEKNKKFEKLKYKRLVKYLSEEIAAVYTHA